MQVSPHVIDEPRTIKHSAAFSRPSEPPSNRRIRSRCLDPAAKGASRPFHPFYLKKPDSEITNIPIGVVKDISSSSRNTFSLARLPRLQPACEDDQGHPRGYREGAGPYREGWNGRFRLLAPTLLQRVFVPRIFGMNPCIMISQSRDGDVVSSTRVAHRPLDPVRRCSCPPRGRRRPSRK